MAMDAERCNAKAPGTVLGGGIQNNHRQTRTNTDKRDLKLQVRVVREVRGYIPAFLIRKGGAVLGGRARPAMRGSPAGGRGGDADVCGRRLPCGQLDGNAPPFFLLLFRLSPEHLRPAARSFILYCTNRENICHG
jgi:hypothetical protein